MKAKMNRKWTRRRVLIESSILKTLQQGAKLMKHGSTRRSEHRKTRADGTWKERENEEEFQCWRSALLVAVEDEYSISDAVTASDVSSSRRRMRLESIRIPVIQQSSRTNCEDSSPARETRHTLTSEWLRSSSSGGLPQTGNLSERCHFESSRRTESEPWLSSAGRGQSPAHRCWKSCPPRFETRCAAEAPRPRDQER
jgi:hypothetical protein